jgi:hypothetical protein
MAFRMNCRCSRPVLFTLRWSDDATRVSAKGFLPPCVRAGSFAAAKAKRVERSAHASVIAARLMPALRSTTALAKLPTPRWRVIAAGRPRNIRCGRRPTPTNARCGHEQTKGSANSRNIPTEIELS